MMGTLIGQRVSRPAMPARQHRRIADRICDEVFGHGSGRRLYEGPWKNRVADWSEWQLRERVAQIVADEMRDR